MTDSALRSRSVGRRLSAVLMIAQRDVIKLRRDPLRLAVNLMFPIVLMVGLGSLLAPTVGRLSGLNTVAFAFTGVLAATMFQSAAAGMISLVEDREQDFARELFVAPVSRLALMSGKVAGETLVALCQGACIVVAALVFGVAIGMDQLARVGAACIACALLGASFGLATVAALPNQRSAMQVFQFLIVPQYVLSGVVVPLRGVSRWLDVLGWAMPMRYGIELTRAAFYAGTPGYPEVVSFGPGGDLAVILGLFAAFILRRELAVGKAGAQPMTTPVLLLFADTGGGHRSAAQAVADALEDEYPRAFVPSLYDPIRSWRSPRLLRDVGSLYGPIVRFTPWAWGAIYHASDSRLAAGLLRQSWLRLADALVAEVVAAHRPAAVVSFHPLTTAAAVRAVQRHAQGTPVVTVVTDLVTTHATWRYDGVERIVVPSAAVRQRCVQDGIAPPGCLDLGLPVGRAFSPPPLAGHQQRALRRRIGVDPWRFLVVLAGGAEGSGQIARCAAAIADAFDDIDVVAICGRNRRLERRLASLASLGSGRLRVEGFVENMADWYRAADLVVTKAGPQTIAEATCCGAALLVTSHLPGQERGNTELVVRAGAAAHTPRVEDVLRAVARLKGDPDALGDMRRASSALARPDAARRVASLIAGLTSSPEARAERHDAA